MKRDLLEDVKVLLECDDLTCYICRDRLEEMKEYLEEEK